MGNGAHTIEEAWSYLTQVLCMPLGECLRPDLPHLQERILMVLNPKIQDMAGEEKHFKKAAPCLFREGLEEDERPSRNSETFLSMAKAPTH